MLADVSHNTGPGRRDLDHRLVRLHLQQRLVLDDTVPFRHEPPAEFDLCDPFAQIGEFEIKRHGYLFPLILQHLVQRGAYPLGARQVVVDELSQGHRDVGSRDAQDGGAQVQNRLLGDGRRDLGP